MNENKNIKYFIKPPQTKLTVKQPLKIFCCVVSKIEQTFRISI